ncbi:carboxylesterase/lipase family protein [Corynebacterium nuruki]|jgi:para-nitrobenzyl esterase|uniref:carboxylesterase/lipase family protein n=1 Tax=Corynebacterium nuruki TaxID=1032851 RepID=UPI002657A844|nr:carboxylesterase family protein [Corynebacterium nuruki]
MTVSAQTISGPVTGTWRDGSAAFLGIPYAAAPVGDLRFAAPAAPVPWTAARDATRPGPTPQRRPFSDTPTIPEPVIPGDATLNLNVFTPAPDDPGARLPVLVWLHGGAYISGTPSSPWYDGRSFNRDGIVTVSISYRLGFEGFGWVGDDGPGSLNRGLLDQIAALEWVRDNIAGFGGDPDRVTVAGQSAGGTSVLDLLAVPRAAGLFHRAIAQSPALNDIPADEVIRASGALAETLGIPCTPDGWRSLTQDRILDVERRGAAYGGFSMFDPPQPMGIRAAVGALRAGAAAPSTMAWAPAVDGELFPAPVPTAVTDGHSGGVPLLLGGARTEFPVPSPRPRAQIVDALRAAGLGDVALSRFGAELDLIGDAFADSLVASELQFGTGTIRVAEARRQAGAAGTWLYDFNGRTARGNLSPHCTDIPYSFDLLDAPGVAPVLGEAPSQVLADAMHGDWVRFITDGTLDWPTVEEAGVRQARVYDAAGSHLDPDSKAVAADMTGV